MTCLSKPAASLSAAEHSLATFDSRSGSLIERGLFNHRGLVLWLCLLLTLGLGAASSRLGLNASFEKMIPTGHPYIANYLANQQELTGLGNAVRIAVEAPGDSIYDAHYLDLLARLNDKVFLLPGVDRPFMKSLWTPNMRWMAVTEEGVEGGRVIPDDYDGSAASLETVRRNAARSGEIGQIIALDARSSLIFVPLMEIDPNTGKALDYAALSRQLEQLRGEFQAQGLQIHITGFVKVVGDLMEGLQQVLLYFAVAILIATAMLYGFTRCLRSTLLVMSCSLVAVAWQLGLVALLGFELDPYSVLVPFLVLAIGMSHGAQKMNGIMQDIGRGMHRRVAARFTFRRLFLAGLTALLCDAVGFAVLMLIDIKVIQDLALIASIGVAVLVFTNLILLPILLSYCGVSPRAAARSLRSEAQAEQGRKHPLWAFLDRFTRRRWATVTLLVSALLAGGGYWISLQLQVGDLDAGAPELRADSRYNRDNGFMVAHYGASSDVFAVIVRTPDGTCSDYAALMRLDALEWRLRQLPGVESTASLASLNRSLLVGMSEGNPKWYDLTRNQALLNSITGRAPRELFNQSCNTLTLYTYLSDHKAVTLTRLVNEVEAFAQANNDAQVRFLLAAGNAGIEAATNIVVRQANHDMLFWVYGAVILLCLLTFRSLRAVICVILPLALTSILCEALMVWLGIGVKVATLPVIALGVGIGVDYALYVMSILLARQRAGESLSQAYYHALLFTGKVVMLTGVTLAVGVATWAFSPIKFQADMGILLAFMFLLNMIGALVLLPALAHFLLPRPSLDSSITTTGKNL
ncbi:efflux RND transporter permease subunit [Pseudomonas gingeri]|uniref:efflux RND transporter permease subunit n=1 Tax=Pseudomonas gingeri TaxID=117681 RepID=UPI0015A13333|nr:MMPL family transporter [Pseudomonas gingeri]NWA02289.1 RND family transporter [Pseudomonas gingeri]NWA12538.1 RND family transporter [Pseudomonas gingeri]NWA57056.1 RND family transporter [Pseudomonas gingeri]NWA93399.1 RND family transporter [Pseudomonas gingeri]NWB02871.1 RND family transporter [Pseudomonas gingeri]